MGHVDRVSHDRIAGWAADPDHPDRAVEVIIRLNGRPVRVVADRHRADLAALFPRATGRYGFQLDGPKLSLSPFMPNRVEVVFAGSQARLEGGDIALAPIGSGPRAPLAGQPAPLLITTPGRSGSSLLMARLSRHPAIVVARGHPYEVKLLTYYAAALRTLAGEADLERSTTPDTMAAAEQRFFVGANPYHDGSDMGAMAAFWRQMVPDRLGGCFVDLIDAYYARAAQAAGKTGMRYFAEKIGTTDLVREATCHLFGQAAEIVLVRDPRDLICSSKSFWGRDFDASLRSLRAQFMRMMRPRNEQGLRQHVVRYEDLLLEPHRTMQAICAFLGVADAGHEEDEAEARVFASHGTSASPAATIGRWRRELSADHAAAAAREFAAVREVYGYA
jgi:hypothetical protein